MHTNELAKNHSTNCFLNSLFREWGDYSFDSAASSIDIKLKDEGLLKIPVKYFSLVGRHSYADTFFFKKNKLSETSQIDFLELVEILLEQLSLKYKTNHEEKRIFLERIKDSLSNISTAIDLRLNDIINLYENEVVEFIEAEQGLVIGHSFHPHPKNRDEFSNSDFKKYSPEAAGTFHLHWTMVHVSIIHSQNSNNFNEKDWSEEIFLQERTNYESFLELKERGYFAFPIHPWQKNIIFKMPIIADYLSKGLIVDLGASEVDSEKWYATSSLRSIYNKSSPYMLKFSLSVRLTNSTRHLLPQEVVRGLQVLDVFTTDMGGEYLEQYPQFNILFEPGFMAITDHDKQIINETIVALRINPFIQNSTQKIVLATLTQDNPLGGLSLIGHQIKRRAASKNKNLEDVAVEWFENFLMNVVKPCLMAQANFGVLLGAHQQNLILEIKENLPMASFFRDCQGTGYSKTGYDLFNAEVDLMTIENGNVLSDEMGNTLFAYYLIINSTFNVISAIAKDFRDTNISEENLMRVLKNHLTNWQSEGVRDSSCFKYLLESPQLLQKGNFHCSFVNMNENTTPNPLGIYNAFPNPIYETKL